MPVNRFFIEEPLIPGSALTIDGAEFEHMRVLRLEVGEQLELVNGQGELATAEITAIGKRSAEMLIAKVVKEKTLRKKCALAIAAMRMAKLEWVVEKGTELGVSEFWIFPAEFSEKESFSPQQKLRLKNILIAAMKQCGRTTLPQIKEITHIKEMPKMESSFFGDVEEEAPFLIQIQRPLHDTLFFIGPEKGFSESEIKFFKDHHIKGVRLAGNTLRAETAAITAAALVINLQINF